MDIYILRHGKASNRLPNIKSDAKRKLTEAGKMELEEIMKGLKNFNISFDFIISSPLTRALETAEITAKHIGKKNKITIWDELKPESSVIETQKKLSKLNIDSKILLVGHEPHLTNLIISIISTDGDVDILLKKGGLAHLRVIQSQSKIIGSLRSLLTPKQLKLCK